MYLWLIRGVVQPRAGAGGWHALTGSPIALDIPCNQKVEKNRSL
jgi:hypothetical protein